MKPKSMIILILILIVQEMSGQTYNLDSIFNRIEKNHPELQMYDLQIKAYNTYATGASAWDAPQLAAGLYMVPYTFEKNMGALMFTATQMIPNPAKLKANKNYMLAMSGVENETKKYVFNQLVYQAKTLYYEWLILKKKQSVLTESEDLLNYIIETSEARYIYKQEKLSGIYKSKAELAQLKSMQLMIDGEIEQKRILLNTLMNRDKNTAFDIDTAFVIKEYEQVIPDTSQINTFRSDIRAIDQTIKLTQLKQQVERYKSKPDFGIRFDHANAFGVQPDQFSVMGMITIPIAPWSSKMYKANVSGLNYEIESLQKQKEAYTNEISGMITALVTEIKNKKAQVKLYQNNIIPALQKNYKTTLLAYEQNTEELFMVLDAWQTLKMTELEYLDRLLELMLKQAEYEKENEIK
jgi:cobalt-zinc-cadmium efflux system outer membrane protein